MSRDQGISNKLPLNEQFLQKAQKELVTAFRGVKENSQRRDFQ